MKKLGVLLCLVAAPAANRARELPRPTPEGIKALDTLLRHCLKAKGLKAVKHPKTGTPYLAVADAVKLKAAVAGNRGLLTAALRDTLIGGWQVVEEHEEPAHLALLRAAGEATGDERLLAFADLFTGQVAKRQRAFGQAVKSLEKAAGHFQACKDRSWQGTALHEAGRTCQAAGDADGALKFYRRTLDLRLALHGENHRLVATTLNNLGVAYAALGAYADARVQHRRALAIRRKLHGDRDHGDVAWSLRNLGFVSWQMGDYRRALDYCRQALAMRQRLFPNGGTLVIDSLVSVGTVHEYRGEYDDALRYYRQALESQRKLDDRPQPAVADTLNNIGTVLLKQGKLHEARNRFEESLALRRRIYRGDHPDLANSFNQLGTVWAELGDYDRALGYHRRSLALRRRFYPDSHPDVARSLNNVGGMYKERGDFVRARAYYTRALQIWERAYRRPHPDVAFCLDNIGRTYHEQGDYLRALRYHQRARDVFEAIPGKADQELAKCLTAIGDAYRGLEEYDKALASHRLALAVARKAHGNSHPAVASSLNNLGVVHASRGEDDRALKYYRDALAVLHEVYGSRHSFIAATWQHIAGCHERQGNPRQALDALARALDALRRADELPALPLTVSVLSRRARLLEQQAVRTGDLTRLRQCMAAYARAAAVLDRLRSGGLESDEGKLFRGARNAALVPARVGLAATLFQRGGRAADLHTAFTALEQGRARVFLEALARSRSGQLGGLPAERRRQQRDLLSQLREIEGRLDRENGKPLDRRNADLVKALDDDRRKKESELKELTIRLFKEYPQYAGLQFPRPCILEEARACLADNEVAVLFALDRKDSYAVIVQKRALQGDRGQGVAVVKLPGSDVLTPLVTTLADEEVLKSDSRCRVLGARLFDLLLQPLQEHIRGKNLLIAPDGSLWTLPFEVLVEGRTKKDAGKYLVQTRRLRYTISMTVLHLIDQWEKTRKAPSESLWALGDPVFSKEDKRARGDIHRETENLLARYVPRGGGPVWERLPATAAEVRGIGKLCGAGKDDVVTDTLASEAVVKAASAKDVLARKRYLHLATHGILGSALGRPPSLVLSLVGNDGKEELGGVNDGFLTMQEVTHLKLNADLVVLSACQTGKGEVVPGEGVMGLTRSFLYAGSKGVVCSLWQVEDEQTARLMQRMYAELKQGKPSAEALALARRQLIAEERAPFYWAPFILIGK